MTEFAGVLADERCLQPGGLEDWECTEYSKKLFTLCRRMVGYIHKATVREGVGQGEGEGVELTERLY